MPDFVEFVEEPGSLIRRHESHLLHEIGVHRELSKS